MSKSKQKGTAFETLITRYLQQWYPHAKRNPLAGNKDVGDIGLVTEGRFVLECKNVSRVDLAGWYKEAEVEAKNADVPVGVVVHKRRGKTDASQQWVTMTLGDFMKLVNELSAEVPF